MKHQHLLLLALVVLLNSCTNGNPFGYDNDTHSRGQKNMIADESLKPFLESAAMTYNGLYPKAVINFTYLPETKALNALITDETKTVFTSRDFTKAEKAKLIESNIQARALLIAYEAVTFIVHPTSKDSTLTLDEIKQLLSGKSITIDQQQVTPTVVFDNVQSSNFNFLLKNLKITKYGDNVKALQSTPEVIAYINKNPGTIGIIGYNWLSDIEDRQVKAYRDQVQIVSVSRAGTYFNQPDEYTIRTRKYPFIKELWCLNKGAADGLNTGFTIFLEDEKGQLLIEKAGLVPFRKTARMFNFEFQ